MLTKSFIKQFPEYDTAFEFMKRQNVAFSKAGNEKDIYCVVPGWEGDDYVVVDLMTAIELGLGYVWSTRGWVSNPWEAKNQNHECDSNY